MVNRPWSFLIPSWVDLPHVFDPSPCIPSQFRDYQLYFCLPITSPSLTFLVFLIPCTFHPRRWPLAFPRCSATERLSLNSYPLDHALTRTGKSDVRLRCHALSSPVSIGFTSKGPA